jgi:hypothetical protein
MRTDEKYSYYKGESYYKNLKGRKGGNSEGSLLGSRGDKEQLRFNPEKGGSRTNKKI